MKPSDYKKQIISILGDDYIDTPGSFELRYQCPFCEDMGLRNDDYKMYVNYSSNPKRSMKFFCHRCESGGNLSRMTDMSYLGSNSDEAVEVLTNALINLSNEDNGTEEEEDDFFLIPKDQPVPGTTAWNYIIERGITPYTQVSF